MAGPKTPDEADEWGATLDGKEAPTAGVNKEMLRRALSLNPAMRKNASTTDIMDQLEAAQGQRTVAVKEEPAPRTGPVDLVDSIVALRQRYAEDRKRLKEEMTKLAALDRELGPKTLERVIDSILAADPNMVSITTQEIMKQEAGFLTELGFSAKKVVERKLAKKKP